MSEEKKVCPNCGNYFFFRTQQILNKVVAKSDGTVTRLVENIMDGLVINDIQCTECKQDYSSENQLVTESYFHEVIAPKQV